MTRVYLPLNWSLLRAAHDARGLAAMPRWVHAVTPALRTELPDADEELLEYLALGQAARASVLLLDPADPPRRVVLAVDVDDVVAAGDAGDPTLAHFEVAVGWRDLAAVHVDDMAAAAVVQAARNAVGLSGEEAAFEVLEYHELGWYAVQELTDLLEDAR